MMQATYTIRTDPEIHSDIQRDLDAIIDGIQNNGVLYDSIYLVGSFGHGEGTVHFDGKRWRAINDYDLFVVGQADPDIANRLRSLGHDLAMQHNIEAIDIGWIDRKILPKLSLTMQNYDFRYGSICLDGWDVRTEMPVYPKGILPPYEMLRLLCNRSAGLLTALFQQIEVKRNYAITQEMKAWIAIGDIAVYLAEGYDTSYSTRAKIFRALVDQDELPFNLSSNAIASIKNAYTWKITGDEQYGFQSNNKWLEVAIGAAYCAIAQKCTGMISKSILEAESSVCAKYCPMIYPSFRFLINVFVHFIRIKNASISHQNLRDYILFSQPVAYCGINNSRVSQTIWYLRKFWWLLYALNLKWTNLSAARLWEWYCH